MTAPHRTADQQVEVETHAPYLKVWATLAVLTAIEYFWAMGFKDAFGTLVLGLLCLAVIKATLVAMFFMHLKFEGRWVYVMLVPAGILAMVFIGGLYPDVAMHIWADPNIEGEETAAAPLEPGAAVVASAASAGESWLGTGRSG
jgi:cytochrome c oxidase subunit 4